MKWFHRKPQFETSVEDIMVSFWRGSEMVEAGFVKLQLTRSQHSYVIGFAEPTTVTVPQGIDRMVYELPEGCFEEDMVMRGAGSITWSGGPPAVGVEVVGKPFRRCQRTLQARAVAEAAGGT